MAIDQSKVEKWVNALDTAATLIEKNEKIPEERRLALALRVDKISEFLLGKRKAADVLESDADEPYMKSYDRAGVVPGQPWDSDEPYMNNFKDDTHSQVQHRETPPVRMSKVAVQLRMAARELAETNPELASELRKSSRELLNKVK